MTTWWHNIRRKGRLDENAFCIPKAHDKRTGSYLAWTDVQSGHSIWGVALTHLVRVRFLLKFHQLFLPQALHSLHLLALASHTDYLVYGAQLAKDGARGSKALKCRGELVNVVYAIRKSTGCVAGQVHLRFPAIGTFVQRTCSAAFIMVPIAEANRVAVHAFHGPSFPAERAAIEEAAPTGLPRKKTSLESRNRPVRRRAYCARH